MVWGKTYQLADLALLRPREHRYTREARASPVVIKLSTTVPLSFIARSLCNPSREMRERQLHYPLETERAESGEAPEEAL